VVKHINEDTNVDFIYSDEDKLTLNGQRVEPYFKSDFNLDLFLSNNYLNHFSVFKKSLFDKVGGFRKGYEGSQDYDLFLRMLSAEANFGHIDKVLYHWRKIPGSTADSYSAKSYPEEASQKALNDYLEREKIKGSIKKGKFPGSFRLMREIIGSPLVSIIIPFKDQINLLKSCIEGLKNTVTYQNIELILVNNDSREQETIDYLESVKIDHTLLEYNGAFNYSAINNYAVSKAKGEFVLLLNNDIEPLKTGWFEAMLEQIQRKKVAAVGAKLLYPDHTIQHAGVILGINGVASHGFKHLPSDSPGYFMRANAPQNLSACTAACLMIKKSVFEELKGFDTENLKIAFNDIDLCLKIREAGYLIVYTPYAELIHHESKSRGFDTTPEKIERFASEVGFMKNKWKETLLNDPYYNSNLTLTKEDFSLKL
jgi:GT2 family glycosyltransferase